MAKKKGHSKRFITGIIFILLGLGALYFISFKQYLSQSPNVLLLMGGMFFGVVLIHFGITILGASLMKWLNF